MKNLLQAIETSQPIAFGGYSELHLVNDKAVKLIENTRYIQVLQEAYLQGIAAEKGLAPQIYTVDREGERIVVEMDFIDDERWFHADDGGCFSPGLLENLSFEEMTVGLQLYMDLLKANVVHADFHTGNWFMDEDGYALAIDFGKASELTTCGLFNARSAIKYLLGPLEALGYEAEVESLRSVSKSGVAEIRKALTKIASTF